MKRIIYLLGIFTIAMLCLTGCKKQNNGIASQNPPISIKVGHVGHDHHIALYVAMDNADSYTKDTGITVKVVEDRKLYELMDKGKKIADVEIVKIGGGSKMPTALTQGVIDIGFGGVAPVLAAVDSGAPVKLISPLHNKGDMFVVKPDFQAKTWPEFVTLAKAAKTPLRIGYKSPVACAKIIFEEALKHEGITFSGDPSTENLQVHMVNVKGGDKLNVSLAGDLIDGYVGNNPFPSIAVEQGMGRIVCDLEELPPGTFQDHPCCCIAATTSALAEKSKAIVPLLKLFIKATKTINTEPNKAVNAAVRWIGTSEKVEQMSVPTSGYSMDVSDRWKETMGQWITTMDGLEIFRGSLKGQSPEAVAKVAYDFSLLNNAGQ